MRLKRERWEKWLLGVLRAAGLIAILIVVGFPFYWMLGSSFKPLEEMLLHPSQLGLNFRSINLQAYKSVLVEHGFLRYISNSVYISIATVVFSLILATFGGYAVTRLRFQGQTWMSYSILIIYMFPAIVLVIPLYVVFSKMGLRDSLHILILVYLAQTLPVALYMLRSYFKSLPVDLEYAGLTDGCTRFGVIWRIVIPLSGPALATVALYTFIIAWNEFLFAFVFLNDPDKLTLSPGLRYLYDSYHTPWDKVMAASTIIALPVMALFIFFQSYLIKGLTAGGVKGV